MNTLQDLETSVRTSAPLADRLKDCMARISQMCGDGTPPRMTIPVHWNDDDFFITTTLKEAVIDVKRLDSGLLQTEVRDSFGEPTTCICKGVNLRKSIDSAVLYESKNSPKRPLSKIAP